LADTAAAAPLAAAAALAAADAIEATEVRDAETFVTCVLRALTLEIAPDKATEIRPTSETRLV
jgi:hypothetical protein